MLLTLMPGTRMQQVLDDNGEAADHGEVAATGVQLHSLALDLGPVEQWEQLQHRVAAAYGVEY